MLIVLNLHIVLIVFIVFIVLIVLIVLIVFSVLIVFFVFTVLGGARAKASPFIQASLERRSRDRSPLPTPPAHRTYPYFSLTFYFLSMIVFGPGLGISVGALTLPEVVWNRNLRFSSSVPLRSAPPSRFFEDPKGQTTSYTVSREEKCSITIFPDKRDYELLR